MTPSRSSTSCSTATDAGDIDTVMAHGRVLMEGGRVTVVDEAALKERFAEAVRAARLPAPRPRAALGRAGPSGRALRDRLLSALVRHAGGARLPVQPAAPAGLGLDQP